MTSNNLIHQEHIQRYPKGFNVAACVNCQCVALETFGPYYYQSKTFKRMFPQLAELRCISCGLHQVDHSLLDTERLDQYYRENYRKDARIATINTTQSLQVLAARSRALARLAALHKNPREVSRVFELGAGYGLNLLEMGKVFPHAELLSDDLNNELASAAISRTSVNDGPFDVVILSHVLEHLINPQTVVTSVVESLRPGALLLVEVPNEGGGFICQQRGGRPFHEPHITFYNKNTLGNFFSGNFPELELCHAGTAGALIRTENERRQRLRSGPRSVLRKLLEISPPLLDLVQVLYDRATNVVRIPANVDLSDFGPDDERLYLRLVLKKQCVK